MSKNVLNICQVSLNRDIPLIIENLKNFKRFYQDNLKLHIICPENQLDEFKQKLNFKEVNIINENHLISFNEFNNIFDKNKSLIDYQEQFRKRLSWYYQQVLKLTFVINYINETKNPIVIWDADTIILKKILFFKKNNSINYGSTSEFHKAYYETNQALLNSLPKYFISSLAQFTSITPSEAKFLSKKLSRLKNKNKNTAEWLSHIIFKSITKVHKNYNGSLFSEYELIGQSRLLMNYQHQKLISGIREHLNGKLSKFQKNILIFLGYSYIAYEHTHPNKNSLNMLNRNQTSLSFFKLVIKKTFNKFFRGIKHNFKIHV